MTNKIASVFVNPKASGYNDASEEEQMRKQIEKGETAEKVLKEILGFEEVNKFTNLSKAQIIEQMAMLKYRSFSFENKKQKNNKPLHTLLMAIVSTGCGCLGETDSY